MNDASEPLPTHAPHDPVIYGRLRNGLKRNKRVYSVV